MSRGAGDRVKAHAVRFFHPGQVRRRAARRPARNLQRPGHAGGRWVRRAAGAVLTLTPNPNPSPSPNPDSNPNPNPNPNHTPNPNQVQSTAMYVDGVAEPMWVGVG